MTVPAPKGLDAIGVRVVQQLLQARRVPQADDSLWGAPRGSSSTMLACPTLRNPSTMSFSSVALSTVRSCSSGTTQLTNALRGSATAARGRPRRQGPKDRAHRIDRGPQPGGQVGPRCVAPRRRRPGRSGLPGVPGSGRQRAAGARARASDAAHTEVGVHVHIRSPKAPPPSTPAWRSGTSCA